MPSPTSTRTAGRISWRRSRERMRSSSFLATVTASHRVARPADRSNPHTGRRGSGGLQRRRPRRCLGRGPGPRGRSLARRRNGAARIGCGSPVRDGRSIRPASGRGGGLQPRRETGPRRWERAAADHFHSDGERGRWLRLRDRRRPRGDANPGGRRPQRRRESRSRRPDRGSTSRAAPARRRRGAFHGASGAPIRLERPTHGGRSRSPSLTATAAATSSR